MNTNFYTENKVFPGHVEILDIPDNTPFKSKKADNQSESLLKMLGVDQMIPLSDGKTCIARLSDGIYTIEFIKE